MAWSAFSRSSRVCGSLSGARAMREAPSCGRCAVYSQVPEPTSRKSIELGPAHDERGDREDETRPKDDDEASPRPERQRRNGEHRDQPDDEPDQAAGGAAVERPPERLLLLCVGDALRAPARPRLYPRVPLAVRLPALVALADG